MAAPTVTASTSSNSPSAHSDGSFAPINSIADPIHLSPQVDGRVEPYELVELFYSNSGSPATTQSSQPSPRSAGTSSPEIMQVIDQSKPKKKAYPDSYTCEVCTRVFKEASHYTKHKRGALCRKLAQRLEKQKKKKKLSSNSNVLEKKKSISAIIQKPYQCNICGAKFCDKVNVEVHLERTHSTKKQQWVEITKSSGYSCTECDRWYQDKASLAAHQREHLLSSNQQQQQLNHNQPTEIATSNNGASNFSNPSINYQCNICGAKFCDKINIELHLELTHSTKQQQWVEITKNGGFSCAECGRWFQDKANLATHQREHLIMFNQQQQQPSQNQSADVAPSNNGAISVNNQATMATTAVASQPTSSMYFRSSDIEKPYQCNICGTKFCDKVNIELHLERNHGTKQQQWIEITKSDGFSCGECGRWFQNKVALAAHQRQHLLSSEQQRQQPNHNQAAEMASTNNSSVRVNNSSITTAPIITSQPTSSMYYRAPNINNSTITTAAAIGSQPTSSMYYRTPNINNSTITTTSVIGSQPVPILYHQQPPMQMYGQSMQHPHQPPHLPAPPPPAPPPMAHLHNAMPTILHTPQMPLPGTIIPATQNIASQMPMITGVSVQNYTPITNAVESGSKNVKNVKHEKYVGKSKWNVCGDCGHKFVDPMNLELHIQRKHSESFMIEKVNLGGGTVLYKTNNTSSDIQRFLNDNGTSSSNLKSNNASSDIPRYLNDNGTTSSSLKPNITSSNFQSFSNGIGTNSASEHNKRTNDTNSQNFDCVLCGYKANSRNNIISHLKSVHNTSNTNFIHVMENLESGKKGAKGHSRFKKGKSQDPLLREQRHTCEACNDVFLSKAELIRHRIKDKKYMCGVCCHSSCSQQQMTTHMETHNPVNSNSGSSNSNNVSSNSSNNINNSNSLSSLTCWFCGALCASVPSMDEHLASHGSLSAECTYCGHQSGTLETLLPHVAMHLPRQSCSIRLTVSRPDQLPVVHMVEVSVDGNVNSTPNGNSANNLTSANNPNEAIGNSNIAPTEVASSSSSQLQAAYACSQCGTCCTGPAQLEAHLQSHQNTQTYSKQGSNLVSSSASSLCMTTVTSSAQSASLTTGTTSAPIPTLTSQQCGGLTKNPATIEFRCEECGFWRIESEPVMRHIQTHHMSGNMLHSVKLANGNVQVYPIYVVTPISTQE